MKAVAEFWLIFLAVLVAFFAPPSLLAWVMGFGPLAWFAAAMVWLVIAMSGVVYASR